MKEVEININGKSIVAKDFRNILDDYRISHKIRSNNASIDFIPIIDEKFFASQENLLPAVKIDEETYIFPTNALDTSKRSSISDYLNFCITDIDLLVITQNYYYQKAKNKYEKNPEYKKKWKWVDGGMEEKVIKVNFKKRRSSTMTWVQWNLSKFIHEEHLIWEIHKELQEEIAYKQSDFKLQNLELENTFSKGEHTSYGNTKVNLILMEELGIKVKLQNGQEISDRDIIKIEDIVIKFNSSVFNCSELFRKNNILISLSNNKKMHARDALGIFYPYFNAIGISTIGNIERTFAHEVGHFIDYSLGKTIKRHYASDDKKNVAAIIAYTFRRNMLKRQKSEYKNRTKECFARAIEQYYCYCNSIPISDEETEYCKYETFEIKIISLIHKLFEELKIITN